MLLDGVGEEKRHGRAVAAAGAGRLHHVLQHRHRLGGLLSSWDILMIRGCIMCSTVAVAPFLWVLSKMSAMDTPLPLLEAAAHPAAPASPLRAPEHQHLMEVVG
jgi:hypothetical protein